jgi:hypothetical protein
LVDGKRGIFVVNGNIIFMVETEITRMSRSMRFLLSGTLVEHEWVYLFMCDSIPTFWSKIRKHIVAIFSELHYPCTSLLEVEDDMLMKLRQTGKNKY